ncbi:hypothetical protein AK972_2763 [Pseudomonas yamanorum]|nr:hypothetical protein AK972_2763 [Pseudomonas yamanorum]
MYDQNRELQVFVHERLASWGLCLQGRSSERMWRMKMFNQPS